VNFSTQKGKKSEIKFRCYNFNNELLLCGWLASKQQKQQQLREASRHKFIFHHENHEKVQQHTRRKKSQTLLYTFIRQTNQTNFASFMDSFYAAQACAKPLTIVQCFS